MCTIHGEKSNSGASESGLVRAGLRRPLRYQPRELIRSGTLGYGNGAPANGESREASFLGACCDGIHT